MWGPRDQVLSGDRPSLTMTSRQPGPQSQRGPQPPEGRMCDLPHDPVGDPLCKHPASGCPGDQWGAAWSDSRGGGGVQAAGRGPSSPHLWLLLPKAGSSREGVTYPRPALCAEGQAQVDAVLKPWVTFNQGGH